MILSEVEVLTSSEGKREWQNIRNEEMDVSSFLLSRSKSFPKELLHGLAEQIKSRKLLKKKHPSLAESGVFCEKSLLEQSTPEEVARYRASRFSGRSFIDCTGGMGIDTLFLSRQFDGGLFCELDDARAALFSYNKALLGVEGVEVYCGDSISYLQDNDTKFDLLFIDPARRNESVRFFSLDESLPNIVAHWDLLLSRAEKVVVKLSPMIDITQTLKTLTSVCEIEVVSLDGEVKEVMLTASEASFGFQRVATLLRGGHGHVQSVTGEVGRCSFVPVGKYLFDCDASVVKAGLIECVASEIGVSMVHSSNYLLTSDELVEDFPGRSFKVLSVQKWQRKRFRRYLKEQGLSKAVVISRGFPLTVSEIRSHFSLGESDSVFLFFVVDNKGERIVVHGERCFA